MLVYEFFQIQNNWKDGVGGSNGNESTNLPINQFQILYIKKISISLLFYQRFLVNGSKSALHLFLW